MQYVECNCKILLRVKQKSAQIWDSRTTRWCEKWTNSWIRSTTKAHFLEMKSCRLEGFYVTDELKRSEVLTEVQVHQTVERIQVQLSWRSFACSAIVFLFSSPRSEFGVRTNSNLAGVSRSQSPTKVVTSGGGKFSPEVAKVFKLSLSSRWVESILKRQKRLGTLQIS